MASALSHLWQRKATAALTNHELRVCGAGLGEDGVSGTMAVERSLAGRDVSSPARGAAHLPLDFQCKNETPRPVLTVSQVLYCLSAVASDRVIYCNDESNHFL